jgi:hypothetical protein
LVIFRDHLSLGHIQGPSFLGHIQGPSFLGSHSGTIFPWSHSGTIFPLVTFRDHLPWCHGSHTRTSFPGGHFQGLSFLGSHSVALFIWIAFMPSFLVSHSKLLYFVPFLGTSLLTAYSDGNFL